MNKKLLLSVFLCSFIFSLLLLCQEESEEKKIWEDGLIRVTFFKLDRGDSLPEELRGPFSRYRKPKKGNDFITIQISYAKIGNINLLFPEKNNINDESSKIPRLVDEQGNFYLPKYMKTSFKLKSLTMESIMNFEIPMQVKPVQFMFIYPYSGEPPNLEEKKYGLIVVEPLLNQ